ncbi:hypothetical protein F5Y05DRAFT_283329 [Hypoxylon sp. FL0543]|nr:hypothetical protein F5Y05DRAFT_283329 [Hypoxylon sp. FL0543]
MEAVATSFTSRRPAAHTLPQFHLPVPTSLIDIQLPSMRDFTIAPYSILPALNPDSSTPLPRAPHHQEMRPTHTMHIDNAYLTDCLGVTGPSYTSPLTSGVNTNSAQDSSPGIPFYSTHTNWPVPVTTLNTQDSMHLMQPNYSRGIFSPHGQAYSQSSPATADGLPAPAYDNRPSPFPNHTLGGGVGHSTLLSQPPSHQSLQNSMVNSSHTSGSQPPTPSTTASQDSYTRQHSTSSYFSSSSSSTPHPPSFSSFSSNHASPPQPSPTTAGAVPRAIPALSPQQQHSPMQAPHYSRPTYSYGVPGAVLSNVANPGGAMHLMHAGMSSIGPQYAHHPHGLLGPPPMYPHGNPNPQQERPFKCDICTQAFNRNHDLKRHKRIHLAIKPFPCENCEKSFSRKDALKRHRLVKGCGSGRNSPKDGTDNDARRDSDGPSGSGIGIKDEPGM